MSLQYGFHGTLTLRGLKKQDPNRNSLKKNLWTKADGDFKGVTKAVYQASLIWIV